LLTAGIIAEYDPFHNGHLYHIEQTRWQGKATHIVVVMSGNYTQRGTPAACPKRARAYAAIKNGADLVIELPLPFACAPAEKFAFGGISVLNALGCVDMLSFGSECGDISRLSRGASAVSDRAVNDEIPRLMADGRTYAAAREESVRKFFGEETGELFSGANNILGTEYIKQLTVQNSRMIPFTVKRQETRTTLCMICRRKQCGKKKPRLHI